MHSVSVFPTIFLSMSAIIADLSNQRLGKDSARLAAAGILYYTKGEQIRVRVPQWCASVTVENKFTTEDTPLAYLGAN
ncbi:hypothetical protein F5Y10DRAFT_256801 [Nemania abortiva]|nr:hypothetical protein F5Y10DRAFT_256801 [Nemania abortiva]